MEQKFNDYQLISENRLKEVLLENLRPEEPQRLEQQPTLAAGGPVDPDHIIKQPWFFLGSAVTDLIATHLMLDPTWNYLERWLDNAEFASIEVTNSNTVTVAGSLWWGYRDNVGGAQRPEAIEAEFVLAEEQLTYWVKLYADGLCRQITPAGVTRTALAAPAPATPDLTGLLEALKNKGEKAPPKSAIIHMGFGPTLHNINYLTAYTIARSGPRGIEALIDLLEDEDLELRSAAIYALGMVGGEARPAIPAILALLPDASQQLRSLAAVALYSISEDEGENLSLLRSLVPDLLKALNRENFEAEDVFGENSRSAGRALLKLARHDQSLLSLLIEAFENGEAQLRLGEIFYRLGSTASEAIPALARALQRDDNDERWIPARALSNMGWEGLQALIERIIAENHKVRQAAIFTLQDRAKKGAGDLKPAIPALLSALDDNRHEAKLFCAVALSLAHIDRQDAGIIERLKAITPDLIHLAQTSESFTARQAIQTLKLIGPPAAEAIPVLIQGLRDKARDDYWRESALKALRSLCRDMELLTPALIDEINERSWLAKKAIHILATSYSPEAVATLFSALSENLKGEDSDSFGHHEIFEALRKIGPPAIPFLAERAQNGDKHLRNRAVNVLGSLGCMAVPHLIEALSDPLTRSAAAEALGEVGAEAAEAIPALEAVINDSDSNVCARAIEALGRIGRPALPLLIRTLKHENAFVAMWAAAVLGRMKEVAAEAIPPLIEALDHRDAQVRELAAVALSQHGNTRHE
jgi:HEAT repeat protein